LIPLFDADGHPRPTSSDDHGLTSYLAELRQAGFSGACAVALPGPEMGDAEAFLAACHRHKELYPVAAWTEADPDKVAGAAQGLRSLGFSAVKLHPRLSGISPADSVFPRILSAARDADLAVFLCTYQFAPASSHLPADPLPFILEGLAAAPGLRLVLTHGGTVELLRYAELVRMNPTVLLDLSFTMNKYAGSSLDLDIRYLMTTFDQHLCIGTDFPAYRPDAVRARFEQLSNGLATEKRHNIGHGNIRRFLRLETTEWAMS
jgi:predicted TIM-barrel fold metal-dependent hydrolase